MNARQRAFFAGSFLLAFACSGGSPAGPSERERERERFVPLLFTYRTLVPVDPPPLTDPELRAAETGCVHHYSARGGSYVLEGSWGLGSSFRNPSGDCREGCSWVVANVPTGVEHVVRVWDLGLCRIDPRSEPVASRTILAGGVELTRVVDHPSGMRGAAFRVASDGTVTP